MEEYKEAFKNSLLRSYYTFRRKTNNALIFINAFFTGKIQLIATNYLQSINMVTMYSILIDKYL